MRKEEITIYTFAELSESAKERARDWFREGIQFDTIDIIECTILDAAKMLGITIDRPRSRRTGYAIDWNTNPVGAAFAGSWHASDVRPGVLVKEFPQDATLAAIAADLESVAAEFPDAYANLEAGRGCFQRVEAYASDDSDDSATDADNAAEVVAESLRAFAHWIGSTIASEMEYQFSDECVDDSIRANEYEFTANGEAY